MPAAAVEAAVLRALDAVALPDGAGLGGSGRVSGIAVADGRVSFAIRVSPDEAAAFEPVRRAAQAAALSAPGVGAAAVTLTAERPPDLGSRPPARARPPDVPGVAKVIAVASGKGGVGKSTTACNLAIALRASGLRIGLLDADIYGPSQPRLFGLVGEPRLLPDRRLAPMEAFGVKVMSIGLLIEPEAALAWRGPMVLSAITQLVREVDWGPLDILLVDLPPGTGDAHLAIVEAAPLAGAVIVSTPQDSALMDVRRGIAMFARLDVPILGLVENMAHFTCGVCGTAHDIFGAGGARAEAARLGLACLGEVPLARALRDASDAGRPLAALAPDDPLAQTFTAIAAALVAALAAADAKGSPPLASPPPAAHTHAERSGTDRK